MKILDAKITGGFWKKRQELTETKIIWEQLAILKGETDGLKADEYSHVIENFQLAAGEADGVYHGFVYSDSELGKWIEAAAYCLLHNRNKELEKEVDKLVDLICRAQMPDGYINTYFQVLRPESRLKHFAFSCELYNIGHLMEASVAYYEATGKTKFIDAMCRAADLLCDIIGPAPNQRHVYDGHAEIELGLLRLFEATGKEKYRDLAKYFIDERGKQPCFFLTEELLGDNDTGANDKWFGPDHHQAHKPVREQTKADGHAVKVTYLYSAVTDLIANGVDKDKSLYQADRLVWDNMCNHRVYITGAIGSHGYAERFSVDYDLPSDRSYAETCASVGLCFWGRRMLKLHHSAEIYDVMERAMYNGVLSGLSLDGGSYFYVNMLHCKLGVTDYREDEKHVIPYRSKWFKCACCPSNILRLIENIEPYLFSAEQDTLYIDGYASARLDLENESTNLRLDIDTNYPYSGKIKLKFTAKSPKRFKIALRIPLWCKQYTLLIKGEKIDNTVNPDGYIILERVWDSSDEIELLLDLNTRYMKANNNVWDLNGKAALLRGPLVYCVEKVDNPVMSGLCYNLDYKFEPVRGEGVLEDEILLAGKCNVDRNSGSLYEECTRQRETVSTTAIPYFAWGNRGKTDMDVFLPIV